MNGWKQFKKWEGRMWIGKSGRAEGCGVGVGEECIKWKTEIEIEFRAIEHKGKEEKEVELTIWNWTVWKLPSGKSITRRHTKLTSENLPFVEALD